MTASNASRCDFDAMNSMTCGSVVDESMRRPGQINVGFNSGVTPGAQRRVLPTIVSDVRDREREDIRNGRDVTRGIEEELRSLHSGGQDTSRDYELALHMQRQYEQEAENMYRRLQKEKEASEAQLRAQLEQTLSDERVNLHTQVNEMMTAMIEQSRPHVRDSSERSRSVPEDEYHEQGYEREKKPRKSSQTYEKSSSESDHEQKKREQKKPHLKDHKKEIKTDLDDDVFQEKKDNSRRNSSKTEETTDSDQKSVKKQPKKTATKKSSSKEEEMT